MEEKGGYPPAIEFMGKPTIDDHVKMKICNSIYWITGVGSFFALIVLTATIMTVADDKGGFTDVENILCLVFSVPMTFVYLIGLILFIAALTYTSKFTGGKSWDLKRELVISIEGEHLFIRESSFMKKRANRIPLGQISGFSRDVMSYFDEAGIKLPLYYKPFKQAAPAARSNPSLLYLERDYPIEYLVRLDMKKGIPITFSRGSGMKMIDGKLRYDWVKRSMRTVIIPVRPDDQKLFFKIIENEIKFNKNGR